MEMIDDVRKTRREWTAVIRNRVERGAAGTEEESGIINQ